MLYEPFAVLYHRVSFPGMKRGGIKTVDIVKNKRKRIPHRHFHLTEIDDL